MSRLRALAINLAVAGSAIAVLCLGLEAALAVAKINNRSFTTFDPQTGIGLVPGAPYLNRKEGFSEGHFNSHGFRDVERTWEKAPNTHRILVLGDSYVEAVHVPLERAFPMLLETRLNAGSRTSRFEVLGLGQSGFSTADEYMRYLHYGIRYAPDMVILAFFTGNDIRENSKFLSRDLWVRFYFVLDEQGELYLDRSLLDTYARRMTSHRLYQAIKRHSYLLSLISERAWLLRQEVTAKRFAQTRASETSRGNGLDEISDLNIYLPEPTPRWEEAWRITEKVILKFAREVERRGAVFVLVTLSNAEQVHPELQRNLFQKYGLPFDFELPDRRLSTFAREHGINYLGLMPAFRDYHQQTKTYLHGFGSTSTGHWNEAGHRLAAEEIFSFLKERHLVPLD